LKCYKCYTIGAMCRRSHTRAKGDLQMNLETPEDEVTYLRRELEHVSQQAIVSYAMAMDWRRRALTAEEQCRRLRAKYDRLRQRKGVTDAADTDEDPEDAAVSLL
jgi:uncharacterized membrane protein